MKRKNNTYTQIFIVIVAVFCLNFLGSKLNWRVDLTQDQRYTLSKKTIELIESIDEPIAIKVYLQGEFPAEFKRIQTETHQLLEEFKSINELIKFRFIDPNSNSKKLIEKGLQPSRLTVQEDGKVSEAVIFPWALIQHQDKEEKVSLLSNSMANTQEDQLKHSIENLEFAFADGLVKLTKEKTKSIAVLKGNDELNDIYLFSLLKQLGQYYKLAEFTLDSVDNNPQKTLEQLKTFDLALIAKPGTTFSEKEKFALDQFITNGGKTLWLLDNVHAEMDSLMQTGQSLVMNRDLGLTDQLFQYGVRIKYNVVKDLYNSTIRLASGNTGSQTQYQDFNWPYFPLVLANNSHNITKNLDPIRFKFPSSIDTLNNKNINKTVLLQSSPYSKMVGTPGNIELNEIAKNPNQADYSDGHQILGVLLEGEFTSAYAQRIKPFKTDHYLEKGRANKMIVISDGDVAANETFRGEPIPIEHDKWTNQQYGNGALLLNAVHYLLDEDGILSLRSKNLQLQFLDKEKAYTERRYWQFLNLILPLIILGVFGLFFNFYRKRKYSS